MKPVVVHADARRELLDGVDSFNAVHPGLGDDFEAAYIALEDDIAAFPKIGSPNGRSRHRFRLLRRFSYVDFFIETPAVIWVMAIAHASRRPGYWLRRKQY